MNVYIEVRSDRKGRMYIVQPDNTGLVGTGQVHAVSTRSKITARNREASDD